MAKRTRICRRWYVDKCENSCIVYTNVNGDIHHQKQQKIIKVDISRQQVSTCCWVISPSTSCCCFRCVNVDVNIFIFTFIFAVYKQLQTFAFDMHRKFQAFSFTLWDTQRGSHNSKRDQVTPAPYCQEINSPLTPFYTDTIAYFHELFCALLYKYRYIFETFGTYRRNDPVNRKIAKYLWNINTSLGCWRWRNCDVMKITAYRRQTPRLSWGFMKKEFSNRSWLLLD